MKHSRRNSLFAGVNRTMIALGLACLALHFSATTEWLALPPTTLAWGTNGLFFLWLFTLGAWLWLLLAPVPEQHHHQRRRPRTTIASTNAGHATLWREPNPGSRWLDTCHDMQSRADRLERTTVANPTPPATLRRPSHWTLALLQELEWQRFEQLCAGFFQALGFEAREHARGPDRGLELHLHRRGSEECQAIVYCKSWHARQVGVDRIRVLYDLMAENRVARGCYLINTNYAQEAIDFAAGTGLHLLDVQGVLAQIHLLPDQQQQFLLDRITDGDYRTPSCHACRQKMNLHRNAGQAIWRCSTYPACKYRLIVPHRMPEFA